jgi:hypothetical protein
MYEGLWVTLLVMVQEVCGAAVARSAAAAKGASYHRLEWISPAVTCSW